MTTEAITWIVDTPESASVDDDLPERLRQTNPNFDGDKFLRASGLTEEEL